MSEMSKFVKVVNEESYKKNYINESFIGMMSEPTGISQIPHLKGCLEITLTDNTTIYAKNKEVREFFEKATKQK